MKEETGKIWEEMGKRKYGQNIWYEYLIFIKILKIILKIIYATIF